MNNPQKSKTGVGENLEKEWALDRHSKRLWKALESGTSDREKLLELEDLAKNGSGLAMGFLGRAYIFGLYGVSSDHKKAKDWLHLASDSGSIEGTYLLALFYEGSGELENAIFHHKKLRDHGYSPSIFALAEIYSRDDTPLLDQDLARRYYEEAGELGHVQSRNRVAEMMRRGEFGIRGMLASPFYILLSIFNAYKVLGANPNSDKLRVDF